MKTPELDGRVSDVRETDTANNRQQVDFEQDGSGGKVGGTGGIENRTPHRVDTSELAPGESVERQHSL